MHKRGPNHIQCEYVYYLFYSKKHTHTGDESACIQTGRIQSRLILYTCIPYYYQPFCNTLLSRRAQLDNGIYLVFDTVDRHALWRILQKYSCPDKFMRILRLLHGGMCTTVLSNRGSDSEPFTVERGVKEGCIIASALFAEFIPGILHIKTQVLYQPPPNKPATPPIIQVDNNTLENTLFLYLGSLLSSKADIDSEINHHLNLCQWS